MPSFTDSQLMVKMPRGLPMKSPSMMPMGTGLSRSDRWIPSRETPALAKANNGSIRYALQGCSTCSRCLSGEA
ncbi:hypothetical protein D1872_326600 [compost metagenome]